MGLPKIGVCGWYGHNNIGDESYKLSFPKVLSKYDCIFSEQPIPNIANVLGGGDVISDYFIDLMSACDNKHILSASFSKTFPQLKNYKTVALRDMDSLVNASLSGIQAIYCPDFAFALDGNAAKGKELLTTYFNGLDLYKKIIAVVINAHLLPEYLGLTNYRDMISFEYFSNILAQLIDGTMASFVFLPFSTQIPWDDRVSNAWIAAKCKFPTKNTVIYDRLSVEDTINIISGCDAVISTRLHSTIFSCSVNTPFIDITHNHKNKAFLDTVGLSKYSMPISSFCYDEMQYRIQRCLIQGDSIRQELKEVADKQKIILKRFSDYVCLD
jgi:polysaccharide pyruvyl transferase WcaK-like protein